VRAERQRVETEGKRVPAVLKDIVDGGRVDRVLVMVDFCKGLPDS